MIWTRSLAGARHSLISLPVLSPTTRAPTREDGAVMLSVEAKVATNQCVPLMVEDAACRGDGACGESRIAIEVETRTVPPYLSLDVR